MFWGFYFVCFVVVVFFLFSFFFFFFFFLAGIMSGSFESMPWNVCVHRLHLGLYSNPKVFFFLGN